MEITSTILNGHNQTPFCKFGSGLRILSSNFHAFIPRYLHLYYHAHNKRLITLQYTRTYKSHVQVIMTCHTIIPSCILKDKHDVSEPILNLHITTNIYIQNTFTHTLHKHPCTHSITQSSDA